MQKRIFNRSTERELGFGSTVSTRAGERIMGPDGSMNVRRHRLDRWADAYFNMVSMSWGLFIGLVLLFYGLLNGIFAGLYCLVGIEHLAGIVPGDGWHNFMEAYFFSTQTLTTVGYGRVAPMGIPANLIASAESLSGLLSFALISGMVYGRFSRSTSHIVFSENMLVSPYRDGRALMFRMVNAGRSELIDTEARILIALNQTDDAGQVSRRFHQLKLELDKIPFFSLSWTVVHPLNEDSPLAVFSEQDLLAANAEFLILVRGTDESDEQAVHARRSYTNSEVVWNAKFSPVIGRTKQGLPVVWTEQISDFERLGT